MLAITSVLCPVVQNTIIHLIVSVLTLVRHFDTAGSSFQLPLLLTTASKLGEIAKAIVVVYRIMMPRWQKKGSRDNISNIDIAQWMHGKIAKEKILDPVSTASQIRLTFGERFLDKSQQGELRIKPVILKMFRNLTKSIVIWDKRRRCWRLRDEDKKK